MSETTEDQQPADQLQAIVMTLVRVAVALERIADAAERKRKEVEQSEATPFPWAETCVRTRNCEARARKGEGPKHTCQDLIRIGRSNIMPTGSSVYTKSWRNFGPNSLKEVDAIMERLGFSEEWLSS